MRPEKRRDKAPQPSRNPLLVQATIAPVDVDGKLAFGVGTVAFAVASVVLGLNFAALQANDDTWWLGVTVAGFVVGVAGLAYCRWRS